MAAGLHIDIGGPTYAIEVGGRTFHFELPAGCGLAVTSKDGRELKDPPPKHPFWTAVDAWQNQGERVVDGKCVWKPIKPPKLRHLWGNNYEIISEDPS